MLTKEEQDLKNIKRTNTKYTKEQKDLVINMYLCGESHKIITDKIGISSTYISVLLRNGNISKRERYRKNFLNQEYFSKINTFNKAYFLGLIIADGNINQNKKQFTISLNKRDLHILESFIRDIEYTGNITVDKSKPDMVQLNIGSKKLCNDLINLGCIPNKSHFTYFPDIEEKYWSHFIRGVFDGDGWVICSNEVSHHFGIIGNFQLINRIEEILVEKCNLRPKKLQKDKRCKGNIVSLVHGGFDNCKRIEEYIYKDVEYFLIRKKEKFNQMLPKFKKKRNGNQYTNNILC